MSIRITDDPEKDFDTWDFEQTELLELLPKCKECGEYIQDDFCYEIDGNLICEECMDMCYKKFTEDYIVDERR